MILNPETVDNNAGVMYNELKVKKGGDIMKIEGYVWETDEDELQGLIDTGYAEIYADISLSVIYEELTNCFTDEQINEQFGYYGLNVLLYVCGTYYWLMQV